MTRIRNIKYGLILLFTASFFAPLIVNSILLALWLMVAGFEMIRSKNLPKVKDIPLPLIFLLIYFMWMACSLIWSDNFGLGVNDLSAKLSLILLPFLGLGFDEGIRKQILFVFVVVCTSILILAYGLAFAEVLANPNGYEHFLDAITYEHLALHVNFQSIYLSLYTVCASFILISEEIAIKRGLRYLWIFFLIFSVIMLSSRTEIMVLITVCSAYAFYQGRKQGKLSQMVLLIGATLFIVISLISASPTNRLRFKEMLSSNNNYKKDNYGGRALRLEKWRFSLECYQDFPFLGTGIGDYREKMDEVYFRNSFEPGYKNHYNSHNQYLQILVSYGPFGLLLLLAFICSFIRQSWISKDLGALGFAFILSLSMVTESMFERQRGLVFLVFFSCVFLSEKAANRNVENVPLNP